MSDVGVWDSDRVKMVGDVLTRYSAHIRPGHKIRMGLEGDPCNAFRSTEDAEALTVTNVQRFKGEYVEFTVEDRDGNVSTLNNRTIHPEGLWEIHPKHMSAFKGHVDEDMKEQFPSPPSTDYRAVTTSEFRELSAAVEEFKTLVSKTFQHITTDLLELQQGRQTVFAGIYTDRYDRAFKGIEAKDNGGLDTGSANGLLEEVALSTHSSHNSEV